MTRADFLTNALPDPAAAHLFLARLKEKHPAYEKKLTANDALLSDVLMLVSCSPLFASTLLQDPEHLAWLDRERKDSSIRDKQSMLESLARFSLTHSLIEPHILLARFRRRELMRIFLRDVRRLSTVAEITEEISNLADAILEHALRLSRQTMDNRYGQPQVKDERGRVKPAEICIVSLGKLGSKELNYSSDIDLLFIYSGNGQTSGSGARGEVTNLEYFSKLSESVIKLVGGQGGEGAAYRVDMRLRPHGRVGPLALPLEDVVRYYKSEAAAWERQVLIRSRASAGTETIFRRFFRDIENEVFPAAVSVESALQNVSLSKQRIDLQSSKESGTDIKLGIGGIREIEFIAQALQLAYGGRDKWLRAPHTLVSLDRLADRGHLTSKEISQLFDAYKFLRRLEHILQIENGLQTHLVPSEEKSRSIVAGRLGIGLNSLDEGLAKHPANVHRIFGRVFGTKETTTSLLTTTPSDNTGKSHLIVEKIKENALRFLDTVNGHLDVLRDLPDLDQPFPRRDYNTILRSAIDDVDDFGSKLCALRKCWYRQLIEIVVFDAHGKLQLIECKALQTKLAEASIEIGLQIAKTEIELRYKVSINGLALAAFGLGKLGGGGIDYDSDLDLVFVYDEHTFVGNERLDLEFISRVIETFTNVISSITRDGYLYRIDLRLRPHGGDGPLVMSEKAFTNYFRNDAAIWELLAFLKLRAVGGEITFANNVECKVRRIIHERALRLGANDLVAETRTIREKLERQKVRTGSKDIDIKYAPGGLLDIYFAIRYLQLRFNIPDEGTDRSTASTIARIAADPEANYHVDSELFKIWNEGHEFLSSLDHNIRLTLGRTTRLPLANFKALSTIALRMDLHSADELLENLMQHRVMIRNAFDTLFPEP